jgi:hypothetical protein
MKKQTTKWIWRQLGARGTYIKIGWIYNKNKGVRMDKIRVKINSARCHLDFNLRLDEATGLIAGLGKVICKQAMANYISISG